jgi:hypothetical protein
MDLRNTKGQTLPAEFDNTTVFTFSAAMAARPWNQNQEKIDNSSFMTVFNQQYRDLLEKRADGFSAQCSPKAPLTWGLLRRCIKRILT